LQNAANFPLPRWQRGDKRVVAGGGEQTAGAAEVLESLRPDATPRRRYRAHEGGIVVVVGDQPKIGDEVADLGAVEPRLAAADGVRNVLLAQRLLERTRLVIAAIEHGEIIEA